MTGNVDPFVVPVNDFGASFRDVAHDPSDRTPITRNGTGGEHDDVARSERDVPVLIDGDPRQGSERFALRSSNDAEYTMGREAIDVGFRDLETVRNHEVAEPLRYFGGLANAAADQCHLTVKPGG